MQKEIGQLNKDLSLEKLEEVARKYESDCDAGKDEKEGWPQTSYGMSKLFVNAITKVYGLDSIFHVRYQSLYFRITAKNDNRGVLVNCCSPGYVKTDMSGNSGGTSWDVGARTSVWLSLLPAGMDGPQGCYLAEI